MNTTWAIVLAGVAAAAVGLAIWLYTPDKSRAELEARYLGPDDSYVDAAGMRLHVRDTGPRDAPALLLLHGFGSSLLTWEDWAQRLPEFRVIRIDLPGFGLSGPEPSADYSEARTSAILVALLDRLGVARATVVGNSMGGKSAWHFAAAHPERMDKLILISPDGFASPGFEYGRAPKVPAVMKLLPYVLPTVLLRGSLAPAYGDRAVLTDAMVTRYRDMMLVPGVRGAILDRTGQVRLVDPVPILSRITAPTLLLWGDRDGMIPVKNSADYLRVMPNARVVVLPGLGHVPFEEAPDVSLAPVRAFLGE